MLSAVFAGLYPLIAHASVVSGWTSLAPGWLSIWMMWLGVQEWRRDRYVLVLSAFGAGVVLAWAAWSGIGLMAVYLQPFILCAFLLVFFGRSLFPGETPLVTMIAEALEGTLEPAKRRYTRRVTQVWTLFFATMLVELALLAKCAKIEVWSLFANVLNYVLILALFAGEFWLRVQTFGRDQHPGFFRFLHSLALLRWPRSRS